MDEVLQSAAHRDGKGNSGVMTPRLTYVWCIATIAALGGFLFGYDWVVIGGAKPFYEAYFRLAEPAQQGWAMSCALLGCLIGALCSGVLSERFGRKPSLLIAALVFAVSSIGTGLAGSFSVFVVWRISGGVAIGLASSLSPMYIAEIAPANIRGRLVCLNELTIVLGLFSAQLTNWLIARPVANDDLASILASWNGQYGWRWMFAATAIPAAIFFLGAIFIPESPRWQFMRGKTSESERTLTRIGGKEHAVLVISELKAVGLRDQFPKVSLTTLLQLPYRKILMVGIVLAVLQQWCGINVIFNYAQEVFSAAGYPLSSILFNILITGVVMVLFTFLALATFDRLGRRLLMLAGTSCLVLIYLVLATLFHLHRTGLPMLALVVAAIACYAMTLAPGTWVILSEIFPGAVRGTAMAISTASLWIGCFILTYTFPLLNRAFGTATTFLIYALICAIGFVYIFRCLPETRHKTLEEIEASWESSTKV
jgi:sugar porter (SP) family MFS transporter